MAKFARLCLPGCRDPSCQKAPGLMGGFVVLFLGFFSTGMLLIRVEDLGFRIWDVGFSMKGRG